MCAWTSYVHMRAEHQGCTADSHIVKAKCSGSFVKKKLGTKMTKASITAHTNCVWMKFLKDLFSILLRENCAIPFM